MVWDIGLPAQIDTVIKTASQHKLFRQSRLRLALWYSGVMGAILTLLSLGVYRAILHAHSVTADRELQSVADSIYRAIEPATESAEDLANVPSQLLPNLCLLKASCLVRVETPREPRGADQGAPAGGHYIRVIDSEGKLLATAGEHPSALPVTEPVPGWTSLEDGNGQPYHQIAIALHNRNDKTWAYLLVGSAFRDFHAYLAVVRWSLLAGLLVALALIAIASWWLSDLAMRPIYQSYNQIQQFTADAAHELRTPLAAIRATIEFAMRLPTISEAEAHETLTVVGRQNQRLSTMVSDLLLLSRLDNEQLPAAKSLCDLQDLVSDIVEEMAAFSLSQKVSLVLDIQSAAPLEVLGNEEQLYRLVLNLVNNALTYTPAGGRVRLTLKRDQQWALILVSDTGIGIAPEHQARIFDRFYRIDTARSQQMGNSGLGLAIASAIAKAHSGGIAVNSQRGEGSTFRLLLPAIT